MIQMGFGGLMHRDYGMKVGVEEVRKKDALELWTLEARLLVCAQVLSGYQNYQTALTGLWR